MRHIVVSSSGGRRRSELHGDEARNSPEREAAQGAFAKSLNKKALALFEIQRRAINHVLNRPALARNHALACDWRENQPISVATKKRASSFSRASIRLRLVEKSANRRSGRAF